MTSDFTTDLADFIHTTPLCSTHEHLDSEATYTQNPPDILRNLFYNYVPADLVVAGADPDSVEALLDSSNPDRRDHGRHTGGSQRQQPSAWLARRTPASAARCG